MKYFVSSQWIHLNKFINVINYGKEKYYLQMPPGSMSTHFPKNPTEMSMIFSLILSHALLMLTLLPQASMLLISLLTVAEYAINLMVLSI